MFDLESIDLKIERLKLIEELLQLNKQLLAIYAEEEEEERLEKQQSKRKKN